MTPPGNKSASFKCCGACLRYSLILLARTAAHAYGPNHFAVSLFEIV